MNPDKHVTVMFYVIIGLVVSVLGVGAWAIMTLVNWVVSQ